METCTRLNQFPREYFNDLPCNKGEAMAILSANGKRKKSFTNDAELKTYLTIASSKSQIDTLINISKNNPEVLRYLATQLLRLQTSE